MNDAGKLLRVPEAARSPIRDRGRASGDLAGVGICEAVAASAYGLDLLPKFTQGS